MPEIGIKVLHVDDEPEFLALTKSYLERDDEGLHVDTAISAKEGIELLKSGTYDVVVADYQMPVMDGLEFIKLLRARGNLIPFIMFTGRGREEVAIEALNLGANYYLQKGVDIASMFGTLKQAIQEVVAKKRAEDALRESESKYRTLVENIPQKIFTKDRDSVYVSCNENFVRDLGIRPDQCAGKTDYDFFPRELADKYRADDKRIMEAGQTEDLEEKYLQDGQEVWVQMIKTPIRQEDGRVIGILGIFWDITARRRAAEELQKLSQFRESIIDNANVWLDVIDANGNVMIWNKAAEEISGYSRDEVVGHGRIWEWLYPDEAYRKEITTKAAAIIEKGEVVENFETTIRRKDGQTRIISWHSRNLTDERGTPIESIALGRDFTEQKRAEEALQESERRYRLLAENVRDVIWILDIKNLRFTYMSPSITSLTGHSVEEVMSLTLEELLTPASYELAMKTLAEELTIERRAQKDLFRSLTLELGLNCKDGSTIWVEAKMTFLRDADSWPVGILGVSRDITERKRAKEALKESESSFRSIIESSKDGIIFFDGKTRKIIFGNSAMAELLGCSKEDLVGRSIPSLHPAGEWASIEQEFQKHVRGEISVSSGIPVVRNDGSVFYADISSSLITLEGRSYFSAFFRDITEWKRMVETLKASEQRLLETKGYLGNIIESSADAIVVVDMEGLVRNWNSGAEDYMGYTADEVIGTPNKEFFADSAEPDRIMDRVLREGKIQNYRTIVVRKDGKPVHINMSAALLKDKDGVPIGSVRVSRDITRELELEEWIKKERDSRNLILEAMTDGVYLVSKNYELKFMNKALIDAFGNRVGGICYKVFHNREEPCPLCKCAEVMEGRTKRWEWYSSRKNKTYDLIETPLRNVDGTLSKLTIFRDITERKRAEEKLQESMEKYRSLVESTENSVYLVDRDCRYLFLNEKHLSRLGLPIDKIIGRTYGEIHSPEEAEEFAEVVDQVFEIDEAVQHEHRSHRDGRYFLRTLSPVKDPEGRATAVTVVSQDITTLKLAEDEHKKLVNALEAKNRELERFAYTVSHDLRSPLVTIQGFTAMLQNDLERNNQEKAKSDLHYIANAATKLDRLLYVTLELSRIGRITNPPEDVPFGDIVKDAVEQTAGEIQANGIEISVAEDFPTVHADPMRIVEMLVNLITNSIRYRGEQQHPRVEIGYRRQNGEIVFFVKDNGMGIDKSQYEKVFELFYQVDKNSSGTGAGLAIVKRIIEVHNGKIWIESELGKGCTVCFTLPVVSV